MKEKMKNVLIAGIFALVFSGLFVVFFAIPQYDEATLQKEEYQGVSGGFESDPLAGMFFLFFTFLSIVLFCILMIIFYFGLRYFRRNKK